MTEETNVEETNVEETDWRDALPEDIRSDPNFSKYTSMESFAKGHLNAVSMLGKEPEFEVPENEDERNVFFNKLGRPETSDEYEFKSVEGMPEIMQPYVDARIKSYKELAHKVGLSSTQASTLHDWYMDGNLEAHKETQETAQSMQNESQAALEKEWGSAYDLNVTHARAALAEFASPELVEYLEQTKLGNNVEMIKAFFNVRKAMIGDAGIVGDGTAGITAAGADAQIKEIMARPEYWDSESQERPALVKKVHGLMQQLHPTEG